MRPLITIRPPVAYRAIKPLCGPDRRPIRCSVSPHAAPGPGLGLAGDVAALRPSPKERRTA